MKIIKTIFEKVLLIEPKIYHDNRGYFFESFKSNFLEKETGEAWNFVQDNVSHSKKNVIRGMHYQLVIPNAKLVRVSNGKIYDVVVDIRKESSTFGKWEGVELSSDNNLQLWVPPGFAHGFLVLSDYADVVYRTTEYYSSLHQRNILWNDPKIGIKWPLSESAIVSERDSEAPVLKNADLP